MSERVLLITGANGFLARAVVRSLTDDYSLVALVRPGTTASSHFQSNHESVESVSRDLAHIDVIMHLAACIPSPINAAPMELEQVNVDLVEQLVRAYPDAHHILASSVSVYGAPESLPLTIDSPLTPLNAYGLLKLKAEESVSRASKYTIIRFSSLVGPGMKTGTFIPVIVEAARKGRITLIGDGSRLQNYLDIDDAALMCIRASMEGDTSTKLGVGVRSYSNKEVADILVKLTGASVTHQGEDQSPSFIYEQNDAAAIDRPFISLAETLEKMIVRA